MTKEAGEFQSSNYSKHSSAWDKGDTEQIPLVTQWVNYFECLIYVGELGWLELMGILQIYYSKDLILKFMWIKFFLDLMILDWSGWNSVLIKVSPECDWSRNCCYEI